MRSDRLLRTMSTHEAAQPDPSLRSLELDVPELSEAIIQNISRWETVGQLECVDIRLHHVTPILKSLCSLASLRSLDLSHTTITSEELRCLQGSHSLLNLNLSYCPGVTDLSPVSHIKTLEALKLSKCPQLVGVSALSMLPRLKELVMSNAAVTDEEIRQLSECHTLVQIDLHSCQALTNVNPLSSIATLEVIDVSWCIFLTRVGELGKLPGLRKANFSGTRITDEEIRLLSECHSLVKIDLRSCKALTNVNPLSSIATLEVIDLSDCTSLHYMGELGKLPVLRRANFSGTRITDEEIRLLSECHSLVKIDLRSCKALTNVNPLSSIAALEVIDLSDCTSLTHVGALGKLPVLRKANFSGTRVTDEEIRLLRECHSLVNIGLRSCKALTNVNPLSSIATLEVIDLSDCTSLHYMGELGKLPVLRRANFSGTRITDEEIRLLSECHSLVKIDLRSCKALTNVNPLSSIAALEVIDLSDCTSLTHVGALGKLPVLRKANFSGTRVTDEEIRLLRECHSLVNIGLRSCKALTNVNPLSSIATLEVIDLSGCTSLTHVDALGEFPVLREANLSGTHITDEDVCLLSECRTLVKLNLYSCEALTNVNPLSSIETLEVIDLSGCTSLTHVGALGELPVLKEVYLSETRITDEDVCLLSECHTLVKIEFHSCETLRNLNPLSSIAALEVIDLSDCTRLSNLGVLGEFPVLREANLSGTRITDEDVCLLSECHTLVKIDLHSCRAVRNVNPLSSIATLEVIDLSGCTRLSDMGELGKLPVLREVYFSGTCITDNEIRLLSECHTLVKIDLHSCKALTNVNPLSSIATLEVIDLSGCTRLSDMGELGKLPVLRKANFSGTCITDNEIRLLSECHTLVKIDLHSCKALTNVNPLSCIAALEVIDLSDCTSLTHLGALGKLPVLKEVCLSGTHITDEEIRLLSECHSLVKIDLRSCKALTNVNPLSSIAALEVIDLSDCTSLTHVGALGELPVLRGANFSGTRITDEEIRLLSECHTLVKIDLHSCEALTNVNPLSSIESLEVIDLSGCTSLTLLGALGKLPLLREVNLSGTRITDEDVCLLSECHTLLKIDLSGCIALRSVNPLFSVATLEVIELLWCTSLSHIGALGKLPVLKEVYLSGTRITDEEICLLSECRTLKKVDLSGCISLTNVDPLSSIETLEVIDVSWCIFLAHLGALGELPVLKEVNLSRTRITDEVVNSLTYLRQRLGLPSMIIKR